MMHACGHDGHTAIGLGLAHTLKQFESGLHGVIKLIFQPAEEGTRGARAQNQKTVTMPCWRQHKPLLHCMQSPRTAKELPE